MSRLKLSAISLRLKLSLSAIPFAISSDCRKNMAEVAGGNSKELLLFACQITQLVLQKFTGTKRMALENVILK